jgi:transcriptional regulator with XRE-family HTH domain
MLQDVYSEDMAKLCGKSKPQWSRIENGANKPTIEDMKVIKKTLGLSYEYIIDGTPVTDQDKQCEAALKVTSKIKRRLARRSVKDIARK